jgi:hypothetical protein
MFSILVQVNTDFTNVSLPTLSEVTSGVESSNSWFRGSFWDPNGPIIANWLVFDSLHPEVSNYFNFLSYFNIYISIYIYFFHFRILPGFSSGFLLLVSC